jgi:hypothetical protein
MSCKNAPQISVLSKELVTKAYKYKDYMDNRLAEQCCASNLVPLKRNPKLVVRKCFEPPSERNHLPETIHVSVPTRSVPQDVLEERSA